MRPSKGTHDSKNIRPRPTPPKPGSDHTPGKAPQNGQASSHSAILESILSGEWKDGDILLDDYRVIRLLGRGGMGRVYLVETVTPPRLKYAVKILAKRLLHKDSSKRQFLRELQTWIDLQSHPNIIRCRFFKTIEGRVAIFSEFAEAGSLKTWILNGRVISMERILDIAIQAAWGLESAHRQGVIHLDMKPDNILMTEDGTVKITDFGVAMLLPSFAAGTVTDPEPGRDTPKKKEHAGGMTPAYASPEQFNNQEVALQSDIWSWGASILEMFTGRVTWQYGFMAGEALDNFFRNPVASDRPEMPEGMYRVLKRCLADAPADRWNSMDDIAGELQHLWTQLFSQPYPRQKPVVALRKDGTRAGLAQAAPLTHWKSAAQWLATALDVAGISEPDYQGPVPATKNTPEAQALNDLEILDVVLKMFHSLPEDQQASVLQYISRLHSDKAAILEFLNDFSGAEDSFNCALATWQIMLQNSGDPLMKKEMAALIGNLANLYYLRGEYDRSLDAQEQAIRYLDDVIGEAAAADWINMQARLYFNLAVTCFGMKRLEPAIENALKSVRIREDLVIRKNRLEFIESLVQSYSNTAMIYQVSDQSQNALDYYEKAVTLIRSSTVDSGMTAYARDIAFISQGKAITLRHMKEHTRALEMFDATTEILTVLVDQADSLHDMQQLSINYINRGNLLRDMGRYDEADRSYTDGIDRMRVIISDKGCREFRVFLAKAFLTRGRLAVCTGNEAGIRDNLAASLEIYISLLLEKKKPEILRELSAGLSAFQSHLTESALDTESIRGTLHAGDKDVNPGTLRESTRLYDRFEQFLIGERMTDLLSVFHSMRRLLGT